MSKVNKKKSNTQTIHVEQAICVKPGCQPELYKKQTLTIADGIIQSIEASQENTKNYCNGTLIPGFVDLQVNGGGGVLFNHVPTVESLLKIGQAHQTFGTTAWLPTVVSDSLSVMQHAADAVAKAKKLKGSGVVGIHFEGPHIAASKRGVHSESALRTISNQEMEIYSRNDLGKILVTVAPESVPPDVIEKLVSLGVIVSLGHSNASFEQTQQAIKAGARCFTHLFNAMSQFNSREPGMVGAALSDPNIDYGLILDGEHVHFGSVKAALNANPNLILVTDAMPPVGTNQTEFEFFQHPVKRQADKLVDHRGRLAGSLLTMQHAFKNSIDKLGFSLVEASNASSKRAAQLLQLEFEHGVLAVGAKANMLLLEHDLSISKLWLNGKLLKQLN
jgi:N-acetylglucosamine-6-phosphate deacetylase